MNIGACLPVREMAGDLAALRDFAQTAEGLGLTHLCLRTLGGDLPVDRHIPTLEKAVAELPDDVRD